VVSFDFVIERSRMARSRAILRSRRPALSERPESNGNLLLPLPARSEFPYLVRSRFAWLLVRTVLHVPMHAQVGRHASPQHSPGAGRQNQKPPQHPHDDLEYQNSTTEKWCRDSLRLYTPTGNGLVWASALSDNPVKRPCSSDINPVYQ